MKPTYPSQSLIADLTLLCVSLIWGSAFVAQRLVAIEAGVFFFNGLRFLLGALILLPFAIRQFNAKAAQVSSLKRELPWIILAGGLLAIGAAFQQAGLKYTTAGNAGFITGLYVVFIPVFTAVFIRQQVHSKTWLAALLSAFGLYLLSTQGSLHLNPGDLLELAGSCSWAVHVMLIGYLVKRVEVSHLAIGQYLVCALISLIIGWIAEPHTWPALQESWGATLYTGILSVGIGYTLQASGQRHAPPAHAAIILSLEAVFAAVFGWWFLDESLSPLQIVGCGVMLSGMILAQLSADRQGAH